MAFPTFVDADKATGHVTSNSSSWTLSYPTNLAAGDLVIWMMATDGDAAVNSGWPAGGVTRGLQETVGGGACRMNLYKWIAAGGESGTFSLTLSASEQGSWVGLRITGWYGTLGTDWLVGANEGSVSANWGQTGGGTTSTPDPPSLNPNNWDVEDTLWLAVISVDTSRTVSVWPLADNNYSDPSGGSGGATLAYCSANSAVASLDPGTFTISTADQCIYTTIAVRPGGRQPRNPAANLTTSPALV